MNFTNALTRILRPLVRAMIARGITFPDLADLLKPIFVECAEADFGLDGKRMTDSRISLLTGLQRRDVRAHRDSQPTAQDSGRPLPRIVARWTTDEAWLDGSKPATLERTGERRSFDALVASVSRDMHPRTLLDELERQGAVVITDDRVTLVSESYLPQGDDARLEYFSANLGDHAEAATENLSSEDPPFFERAVHYNQLSNHSIAVLEAQARLRQHEVMKELNAEALRLQKADASKAEAKGRFRCGAFVYTMSSEGLEKR